MKTSYLYLVSGLLSAAILTGCGGSSGGGAPAATPAEITEANKTDLAVAATESAKSAAETDTPTGFGSFGSPKTHVNNIASKAINLPRQDTSFSNQFCTGPGGGIVDITGLENIDRNTTNFNLNMSFTNCDVGAGTVIQSGSATYSGDVSSNFTISYNNLRVTYDGQTETLNGSISCNSSGCTENLNYSGSFTNRTYQTENIQVSGNAFSGYDVSGSVTDPQHGVIEINASNVIFDCVPNGQPSSGSITITSGNGTLEVDFVSCTEFTVTLDGVAETVLWADYGL